MADPTARNGPRPASSRLAVLGLILFALLAAAILMMPHRPGLPSLQSLRLPLEVPAILIALLLARGRLRRILAAVVAALLIMWLVFAMLDIGLFSAFQRPFNAYLDRRILFDAWNILSGAAGTWVAAGIIILLVVILVLIFFALARLALSVRHLSSRAASVFVAAAAGLLVAGGGVALAGRMMDFDPRVGAPVVPALLERVDDIRTAMRQMGAFEGELAQATKAEDGRHPNFSALAGLDVVVVFIESYGRSAVEDPRYKEETQSRLSTVEEEIGEAGLHAVSGWMTSPTVGGLSWLAHGTLLSGLWVDSQVRSDRLVASNHASLNRAFRDAGWKTVGVMPAITMAWPEARYFAYDDLYVAANLGYRGEPFNWITMPDQYTLSAFERFARPAGHAPVMAEIALISSHAPWTPVPRLIGWDDVGDGEVFNEQAHAGDPPSVVWADEGRIRSQYVASINYSLQTLGSWMARYGRHTLFVLLGDHQPAAVVTGEGASRAVPVHIVSDDPALLDRLQGWSWTDGMIPAPDAREMRMDAFRAAFTSAFDDPD